MSDAQSETNSAQPTEGTHQESPKPELTERPSVETLPAESTQASRGGPLSLEKIRQLRMSQLASSGRAPARPTPPQKNEEQSRGEKVASSAGPPNESSVRTQSSGAESSSAAVEEQAGSERGKRPRPGRGGRRDGGVIPTPEPIGMQPKVAIPSRRQALPAELEMELNAALGESDLDKLLVGDSMLQVGHELAEGQRLQAKVMKAHGEFVFVSLGGPNEGVIPALQFETLPEIGSSLDVIVRGFLHQEGLYEVTVPGNTVDVSDWSDLNEGEVVEALVTGSNTGGLQCKVGSIEGFIPASQASEFRIEDLTEMVGQKLLCVVTEANPRRGNLVLSHRAVLEREKKEKRAERLASLEVGAAVEGIVRKILDFGAFVDIGGLDGLLHISQLSWERVNHPSEILTEGQKIQVRVDKIDEQTGKIGLSYRSLQDHPWDDIDARFPAGAAVHGTVTRIAEFGAFVRIATGVEGLIHVSELAHHRVSNVSSVVKEGDEVDVKVLSVDGEQQRISLSLKAAQIAPQAEETSAEPEVEEARPEPVLPKHRGPLKGGTGKASGGEQFGLKW